MSVWLRSALTALAGIGAAWYTPAAARPLDHPAPMAAVADATRHIRVPSGTDIPVSIDETIAVKKDNVGDRFRGHVSRDVKVGDKVAIPEGSPVEVTLTTDDTNRDRATLRLSRLEVKGKEHGVKTEVARADVDPTGLSTGEKTAAGAVAGAVVGAVTGAGVLKGAVVGAGGGLAWGLLDERGAEIKENARVRFALKEDLNLK